MKSSLSLLLLSTASTSVFGDSLRGPTATATALSDCINSCDNTSYKSSYDSYSRLCRQWCISNCDPQERTPCDPPADVEDFNFNRQSLAGTLPDDVTSSDAEQLNHNLQSMAGITVQGPSNKHQCYNHCDRHTSWDSEEIEQCKADCDEQYDPPQCYNLGDSCQTDSDCWQGGTNMCTKCGTQHGTEYYKRCYGGETPFPTPSPVEPIQCYNLGESCDQDSNCWQGGTNMCTRCGNTHGTQYYKRCYGGEKPFPTPSPVEPIQCYNLGESCDQDSDCWQGGTNMCTRCGNTHGTQYYKRCYGEDMNEDGDYALLEFDESGEDGPTWDDIKNGTKRAARKTADGAKNAADKTKEWGQKTFDPSSGYAKSSALFVAMGAVVQAFFV